MSEDCPLGVDQRQDRLRLRGVHDGRVAIAVKKDVGVVIPPDGNLYDLVGQWFKEETWVMCRQPNGQQPAYCDEPPRCLPW